MITLTDKLVKRLKYLREQENTSSLLLRITVNGGGCQGYEYSFSLETKKNQDDRLFEKDGVGVIIDEISLPYLNGAEIDFADDLIGEHFKINNPNAKSSCGCGTSFSVND